MRIPKRRIILIQIRRDASVNFQNGLIWWVRFFRRNEWPTTFVVDSAATIRRAAEFFFSEGNPRPGPSPVVDCRPVTQKIVTPVQTERMPVDRRRMRSQKLFKQNALRPG